MCRGIEVGGRVGLTTQGHNGGKAIENIVIEMCCMKKYIPKIGKEGPKLQSLLVTVFELKISLKVVPCAYGKANYGRLSGKVLRRPSVVGEWLDMVAIVTNCSKRCPT